jgi:hypothetical protein
VKEKDITDAYDFLLKTGKDLSGGNCGQSALAVWRWIKETTDRTLNIGLICNRGVESDADLLGDVDIYHVYLVDRYTGKKYDETGSIDDDYLIDLAYEQYDENNPVQFIFDMPAEAENLTKIISRNTAWEVEWVEFYNFLKQGLKK